MSLQLSPERMAALKAAVLRDLDWVESVVEDYRLGIRGLPTTHGLQDLEHAVTGIRERIEKAKAEQAAADAASALEGGATDE